MDHEATRVCAWCEAKLGKGAVLVTTALSQRGRKRPMCIKCAVWSLTGHAPPYVPTETVVLNARDTRAPAMRRSA